MRICKQAKHSPAQRPYANKSWACSREGPEGPWRAPRPLPYLYPTPPGPPHASAPCYRPPRWLRRPPALALLRPRAGCGSGGLMLARGLSPGARQLTARVAAAW